MSGAGDGGGSAMGQRCLALHCSTAASLLRPAAKQPASLQCKAGSLCAPPPDMLYPTHARGTRARWLCPPPPPVPAAPAAAGLGALRAWKSWCR